jgi:hypothetical protein
MTHRGHRTRLEDVRPLCLYPAIIREEPKQSARSLQHWKTQCMRSEWCNLSLLCSSCVILTFIFLLYTTFLMTVAVSNLSWLPVATKLCKPKVMGLILGFLVVVYRYMSAVKKPVKLHGVLRRKIIILTLYTQWLRHVPSCSLYTACLLYQ